MNTDLRIIIESLPTIILYVVPGYLFLWVYSFKLSQEIGKDRYLLLKSIVISYLIIIPIDTVGKVCHLISSDSYSGKILVMVIAVVTGYLFSSFVASYSFTNLLKRIRIYRTIHSNIWNDVADDDHGVWIIAYMPEEKLIYKGAIIKYEEKTDTENIYLLLGNYTLLNYDGEVIQSFEDRHNRCVLINTRNVSRIELEYHPQSKCVSQQPMKRKKGETMQVSMEE